MEIIQNSGFIFREDSIEQKKILALLVETPIGKELIWILKKTGKVEFSI